MTPGQEHSRICVLCGKAIDWNAEFCPHCGYDYRRRASKNAAESGPGSKSWRRWNLAAGLVLLLVGAGLAAYGYDYYHEYDWNVPYPSEAAVHSMYELYGGGFITLLGVIQIVYSLVKKPSKKKA